MGVEQFDLTKEVVAERIRHYRKENGLTQSKLAERIGVQKTQVSKLEGGKVNLTLDTMRKIFTALGVKVVIVFKPINIPDAGKQ